MKTNEKLKEILMQMLSQPVESKVEKVLPDIAWACSDKVIPGYDSELEKMARALVDKADRGDIKAIEKICDIIGADEWRP